MDGYNLQLTYFQQPWQLMGLYCSYLLSKQDGGKFQIQVNGRLSPSRIVNCTRGNLFPFDGAPTSPPERERPNSRSWSPCPYSDQQPSLSLPRRFTTCCRRCCTCVSFDRRTLRVVIAATATKWRAEGGITKHERKEESSRDIASPIPLLARI